MAKTPPTKKAPVKSAPTKSAPKKTAKAAPKAAAKPEKIGLKDLSAAISAKLPLVAPATIGKVVEAAFASVSEAFVEGKVVNVKDFGRFELKHRPERQGRNPATGESITIEAKTVPKFTFAKALKEAALGA